MEEAKKLYLFFKEYNGTYVEWVIYDEDDKYYIISVY